MPAAGPAGLPGPGRLDPAGEQMFFIMSYYFIVFQTILYYSIVYYIIVYYTIVYYIVVYYIIVGPRAPHSDWTGAAARRTPRVAAAADRPNVTIRYAARKIPMYMLSLYVILYIYIYVLCMHVYMYVTRGVLP